MKSWTEYDLIIVFTVLLVFVLIIIMTTIYIFFYRKKTELLFDRQKKEAQFEQELASAIIEMKETTLSYIGQELHDDLGQKMSVAKLLINQSIENANEEQKPTLEEISNVIGESIKDLRNLSKSFISEQVEKLGLVESIEKESKRITKLKLLNIDFQHNTDLVKIKPKDSLILFRIIQESINNVLKHSKAKTLLIILEDSLQALKISLKDDGIGFKTNHIKSKGTGLLSIKKRARLINTKIFIFSKTGEGTEIILHYKK